MIRYIKAQAFSDTSQFHDEWLSFAANYAETDFGHFWWQDYLIALIGA